MPKELWQQDPFLLEHFLQFGPFELTVEAVESGDLGSRRYRCTDAEGIEVFSKHVPVGTSDIEVMDQALSHARGWVREMLEALGDHEPLSEDIDYAIDTIVGGINDGDPDNPYPSHEAVLVAEELRRRFPRKEASDG